MNYNNFFAEAKNQGVEALELYVVKNKKFSFSLFNHEINSYSVADSFVITARGIINGKMGYASTEKVDKDTPKFIIQKIKENAEFITSDDESIIFKGSEKYFKKNLFSKALEMTSENDKIALVKELSNGLALKDNRIYNIEAEYEEETNEILLINSYGLKLSSKGNYCYIYLAGFANDDKGETKSGYDLKILTDLASLNKEEFIGKAAHKIISQLGSEPCLTGVYKAVFNPSCTASLLRFFLDNTYAQQVQKNTSLLKDKLNKQVASNKVTISENPLTKNVFFRYFDDEGVATKNKKIVDKGELKTFIYNLSTAKKDNVETTGNGYKGNGKIHTSLVNVTLKPGKKSEEELFEKVGEGIYITSLQGLHAGMNAQSGNFSLQSQGFMIRDGKLAEPVSLITVAGNLFNLFMDIVEVGSNIELQPSSYSVPSIMVKKINVSGK